MFIRLDNRRQTGRWGEQFAVDYLTRSLGWTVLERNWRAPIGEIDIIAESRGELVLVEVRTRRSPGFGTAVDSVGIRKQRRLYLLARWLVSTPAYARFRDSVRIDVIGLQYDGGRFTRIEHIRSVGIDAV
ncbi:MAG: YraN family protein [Alicyclobacillus herbarius]|uniref:YraN family protein n=1 Tax=Alicyclobacillus herbarius TaxID=122960 RepID=UPI002351FD79|nr:YraN family protein [Alicyclobacillus herbarius]MCL6632342.1 YraN family protein [Alicyclobacillus herbarius]